jgi:hypothetical protein
MSEDLIMRLATAVEKSVKPEEDEPVFVFGSNELGRHGGGAARVAKDKFGAIYGQGFGPQGNTFGIPTCSKPTGEPNSEIELEKIEYYVDCFLLWARKYRPNQQFKVTQIGCGLAGWTIEEMAPLFLEAPPNCSFDTAWMPILGDKRKYWGHVG